MPQHRPLLTAFLLAALALPASAAEAPSARGLEIVTPDGDRLTIDFDEEELERDLADLERHLDRMGEEIELAVERAQIAGEIEIDANVEARLEEIGPRLEAVLARVDAAVARADHGPGRIVVEVDGEELAGALADTVALSIAAAMRGLEAGLAGVDRVDRHDLDRHGDLDLDALGREIDRAVARANAELERELDRLDRDLDRLDREGDRRREADPN